MEIERNDLMASLIIKFIRIVICEYSEDSEYGEYSEYSEDNEYSEDIFIEPEKKISRVKI